MEVALVLWWDSQWEQQFCVWERLLARHSAGWLAGWWADSWEGRELQFVLRWEQQWEQRWEDKLERKWVFQLVQRKEDKSVQ